MNRHGLSGEGTAWTHDGTNLSTTQGTLALGTYSVAA